jgi:hypothetical protein
MGKFDISRSESGCCNSPSGCSGAPHYIGATTAARLTLLLVLPFSREETERLNRNGSLPGNVGEKRGTDINPVPLLVSKQHHASNYSAFAIIVEATGFYISSTTSLETAYLEIMAFSIS